MTNYYSSNPQCSPARAALLTGSYGYRVGIPDVLQPYSKRPDRGNGLHHDELTIAELLKERGYATGAIGKWHLGDVLQYLPTRHGFDTWFGIPFSNDMWPLNPNFGPWPDLPLWEDEATVNYTTDTGGGITSPVSTTLEQQYLLEAMTEKAIDFIDTHQTEPFFLYFSPHVPHVPCWPHPDFFNGSGTQGLIDNLSATSLEPATIKIAPVIDPGAEQTTAYSVNLITLAGAVTDDGLPGVSVTTKWIQNGGPGTATFADPAALNSSVSFDYPGAYKLRLIADDGQIKAFRDRTMMLAGLSMEEWAVAESVPPGQAGTLDNPDRDPWFNLWEFALGLNPNHPEGAAMPIDYMIAAPAMTSVVSFKVPRDRLPAIVFETSPDLKDWYSSGNEPTIEVLNAEWAQWTFTYTPEISSDPFFLRLSVTEPHIEL